VQGDKGFCGLTPEVLFNFRKGRLNTMALAGTARSSEQQVFAYDEKEIREHEFVAQTLVSKLSDVRRFSQTITPHTCSRAPPAD